MFWRWEIDDDDGDDDDGDTDADDDDNDEDDDVDENVSITDAAATCDPDTSKNVSPHDDADHTRLLADLRRPDRSATTLAGWKATVLTGARML